MLNLSLKAQSFLQPTALDATQTLGGIPYGPKRCSMKVTIDDAGCGKKTNPDLAFFWWERLFRGRSKMNVRDISAWYQVISHTKRDTQNLAFSEIRVLSVSCLVNSCYWNSIKKTFYQVSAKTTSHINPRTPVKKVELKPLVIGIIFRVIRAQLCKILIYQNPFLFRSWQWF